MNENTEPPTPITEPAASSAGAAAGGEDKKTDMDPAMPEPAASPHDARFVQPPTHDRRQFSVFQVDEFIFQPTPVRTSHWSVPWSDLMMTLFILFLVMFVYQTSNKQLAVGDETEVIGGQTTGALDVAPSNTPSVPSAPIKPGIPLITAGTIKKIVPIHEYDLEPNIRLIQGNKGNPAERIHKSATRPPESAGVPSQQQAGQPADDFPSNPADSAAGSPKDSSALMNTIAATIARYNLSKYASVDLDADSDVRITLSSDLFFTVGKANLAPNSMAALQKIAAAIKNTPFMIQVTGHTDSQPSTSERFPSNWELSVARASAIARFFIEEVDMDPNQFIVSGFSSYRPLYPNTTQQNRSANRRIEVLISQKRPQQITVNNN